MINFSDEDIYVFNEKDRWLFLDSLDFRFSDFMAPHSNEYFSSLNGLFLFRVKSLQSLNSVDHVLARDGVLPLLKFFWDYPEPRDFFSSIIIHESCSFLVPSAWLGNVYYYRDKSLAHQYSRQYRDKIFLTGMASKDTLCTERALNDLEKILQTRNVEEAYLCLYTNKWLDSEMYTEDDGSYFELVKGLTQIFGDKLHFVDWKRFNRQTFSDAYFCDLNTYPFFYSDSYIKHRILSCGGELVETHRASFFDEISETHLEELSPYHGYEVFSGHSSKNEAIRKDIEIKLKDLQYSIGDSEKVLTRNILDYPHPQICTDDLKAFAREVCLTYLSI